MSPTLELPINLLLALIARRCYPYIPTILYQEGFLRSYRFLFFFKLQTSHHQDVKTMAHTVLFKAKRSTSTLRKIVVFRMFFPPPVQYRPW